MKNTFELPNPDVVRSEIVEKCEGCEKVFENVCIAYANPALIQRQGCALQSNKVLTAEEIKKINPLKASKRKKRGR